MNDIQRFLNRFHTSDDINTVFTNGCCYWFAVVLFGRFIRNGAEIMYDSVANHFGTKIDDRIYDITGDVTDKYSWKPWADVDDPLLRQRITRDCILF